MEKNLGDPKADITLPGGREITFDLSRISEREYRTLFDRGQSIEDEDALIAKVTGLAVEELLDLSKADFKRIWAAFFKKVREPLSDPS